MSLRDKTKCKHASNHSSSKNIEIRHIKLMILSCLHMMMMSDCLVEEISSQKRFYRCLLLCKLSRVITMKRGIR